MSETSGGTFARRREKKATANLLAAALSSCYCPRKGREVLLLTSYLVRTCSSMNRAKGSSSCCREEDKLGASGVSVPPVSHCYPLR